MRHPWKLPLTLVCLFALISLPLLPAPRGAAQTASYTVTDVVTLGGAQSAGLALDECGRVVGESMPAGSSSNQPFIWDGTTLTGLGTFGGPKGSASGVNDNGAVAGSADNAMGETRPFIWTSAAGKTDLGTAGGAAAYDINDSNQVVGQWEVTPLQDRAYVWTQATGAQVITATWGTPIAAYGINNAGQIVGTAETSAGAAHAFFRSGGVTTEIGTLGGTNSFAYEVNESGVVVGYANVPSTGASRPFHAFRWTSALGTSTPQDLGTLGGSRSIAHGVNASGHIVGYSEIAGGAPRAFLWTDDNSNGAPDAGEMKDLNALAPGTGWTFEEARDINDRGQIVGTGVNPSGARHGFLLTPTNAPPSPCDPPPTPTPTPAPGVLQFSAPTFAVSEDGHLAFIGISRTGGTGGDVSVNYATSNGTATAGSDYTATSGTVVLSDTQGFVEFSIPITDDALDEPGETVNLTLSSPTGGATLGPQATAVLTITDDETAPDITISDVTVTEGNTGSTVNAVFNVTLSGPSAQTVTVNYRTVNGTATAGSDYTAVPSTQLTFNPGETSKQVTVSVTGDDVDEPNETLIVPLDSPTNATFASFIHPFGTGTIADDDGTPSLSINNAGIVTEGNSGTAAATFTVSLLPASGQTVAVNYATSNGTATAGSDYAAASGTLTFDPGQTSKTITVNVNGDTTPEPYEEFFVNLSGATNADIADDQGSAIIANDDTSLTINNVIISEGSSGVKNFVFTVSLSHGSAVPVSVNYATADDTATAGTDYTAASSTLTIPAGTGSGTITVQVNGDNTFENDEVFFVNLSGATNATISDAQGHGGILNDEAESFFQFSGGPNFSVAEGAGVATFTVTRGADGSTAGGAAVNYFTGNDTATAGSDYTAVSGTLTFAEGELSKTFDVPIINDTLDEGDERVFVSITRGFGATMGTGGSVFLSIIDDDDTPTLSVGDATVAEGDAGTTGANFTVTLSPASSQTVTVNYATANGTAAAGSDYVAASGALTFAPGETSKAVTVNVNGDTSNEADETFSVNLSGASNASISDSQGVGTILNDDGPTFEFAQPTFNTDESAHFVTVTVNRTGDASLPANVDFATSDGTATERKDYTAVSGTLRYAAGETSKSFDVLLTEDAFTEALETINLALSNPTGGASLGPQETALVFIAADDNPPPAGNPIDNSSDFVRQHYHDFLNREPDAPGLAFWTGEIEQCGADAQCREVKRINVSAAFFLSIEFQETGYLVYRAYKAAYGDATSPGVPGTVPVVRLREFLPDTRRIGEGVIVNVGEWREQLEDNKNAYLLEFVRRTRFTTDYPGALTPAQFVDKLNQNAGGVLDATERANLISELAANNTDAGRAAALRRVAEDADLVQAEFRRAFVLMQYYGYLRRNPDDAPEAGLNFAGWNFWLGKLNEHNGNHVSAEMVKAFLDSGEYRNRFGQ